MDAEHILTLKWTNKDGISADAFHLGDALADATLYCEEDEFKVHKVLLSVRSSYFKNLFSKYKSSHPFVVITAVTYKTLKDIIDVIYKGVAAVPYDRLESFLKAADLFKIKDSLIYKTDTNVPLASKSALSQNESSSASPLDNRCIYTKEEAIEIDRDEGNYDFLGTCVEERVSAFGDTSERNMKRPAAERYTRPKRPKNDSLAGIALPYNIDSPNLHSQKGESDMLHSKFLVSSAKAGRKRSKKSRNATCVSSKVPLQDQNAKTTKSDFDSYKAKYSLKSAIISLTPLSTLDIIKLSNLSVSSNETAIGPVTTD